MRLYERIAKGDWGFGSLADQYGDPDHLRELRESIDRHLREAVRIDVQNVQDYYYSDAAKPEYDWKSDFPNLAPPFKTFWMEYRRTLSDQERQQAQEMRESLGVIVDPRANSDITKTGVLVFAGRHDDGWDMRMIQFAGLRDGSIVALRVAVLPVNDHGELLDYPQVLLPYNIPRYMQQSPMWDTIDEIFADLSTCGPFGLAISLMHCKNVVIDDAPDDRSKKQRKRDERLGREPVQFKTLMIDPMKRVLRTEGHSDTNGIKKAMHICRGHFKTYTEDKPRFGREGDHGQFYVEAHVRGSAEVGMVGKDYAVKAPRE